jgi:hypothetical protein
MTLFSCRINKGSISQTLLNELFDLAKVELKEIFAAQRAVLKQSNVCLLGARPRRYAR